MCFVIDDNSFNYYLMFNIPITIYILTFLYVYIRYGMKIVSSHNLAVKQKIIDEKEINLIDKDITIGGLPLALHMKLYVNIRLNSIYFILWLLTAIPNYFILT